MKKILILLALISSLLYAQTGDQLFMGKKIKYLNNAIQYVDGEALIKVKKNYNKDRVNKVLENYNFKLVRKVDFLDRTKAEYYGSNFLEDFNSIKNSKFFKTVELNTVISVQGYPNDPDYVNGTQWYIKNNYNNSVTLKNDADIDLLEAWDITKGDGNVVIAILDTGIPMSGGVPSHPDLNNNRIILGVDYVNDSTPFNDISLNAHGTFVAGEIGAETNNGIGIAGIAPNCKLMIYKLTSGVGFAKTSVQTVYDAIIDAVNYKIQNSEIRMVINISLGADAGSSLYQDAISYAQSNNVLIVAAAGNFDGNYDVEYPAKYSNNYNNLISVAATNRKDSWYNLSCYGPEVTVCAPGESIHSTSIGGSYYTTSGTSFSAPMISGLAALMLSVDKNLSPSQIKTRIINSVDDLGPSGFDTKYGYGKINAFNTLSQLFADNHPEFTLYKGSLDIYNQQTDIDFILLDVSPSGVAAGRYIADRYVATKTFNHSLDNSNTWYLGMNGYSAANPNNIDYYLYEDVSSNSFTYTTYFYKIRYEIPSGSAVNKWVPWNPYVDGGLDYVVLGNNAPLSASITGPTVLQPYVEGTWTCAASGGVPPYSYSWYFMYPTNPLILKPVSGTWIHLGIDSPQLTRYDDETFQLKCVVTDSRNTVVTSNILTIDINGLAKSGSKKVDLEYSLIDNYPNPFNPTTNINYSIKENSFVSLKVYNLLGEEVANLVHKEQNKGNYSVKFNATNLPSGLYIYRLQARDFVKTKSMILLK